MLVQKRTVLNSTHHAQPAALPRDMFSRVKPQGNQESHDALTPPFSGSFKSSSSSTSSSDGSQLAARASFRTQLVKLNDEDIAASAMDTKLSLDWKSVLLSARVGPARWRLKGVVGDFAIYTRQESQRFGVLAVGVVPGCAAEIVNVLQSRNSPQYQQRMAAVFEDQFKEGSFVHSVDISNKFLPGRQCKRDGAELSELTVKTVTFNKSGWLASHEEWCYVDAVYRNATSGVMEKHMTSLSPSDIVAGLSGSSTKYFQNVTCSYLLRPGTEDDPPKDPESNQDDEEEEQPESTDMQRKTRVTFYGEFLIPKQLGMLSKSSTHNADQSLLASEKTVKQRLVKLAESSSRLTVLVRRQRLGMQALIDQNRFLPPTNVPCHVCTKMLVVAKQCRLCGQGICGDCSSKHELAQQPRGSDKLQVMRIRVCASCLERVDQALYTNIGRTSVLGAQLLPDRDSAKEPANVLKDLLQDALLTAPSPTRKACVMSVIKCVLNQEATSTDNNSVARGSFSSAPAVLSPSSSELDHIQALDFVEVDRVSALSLELRCDENRNYKFDSSSDPATTPVPVPIPENEAARLQAVRRLSVAELSTSQELEILCHVAATEMGCASSIISIIDSDTYYAIASNTEGFRNVVVPRSQSMCSHTMMETSGFMVRHPEADIRFSKFASVDFYGVRYYCALPITGDDGQIIGTMCCVNDKSVDVTESQFSVLKKLAATASKIVRVRSAGRARGLSATSESSTSIH